MNSSGLSPSETSEISALLAAVGEVLENRHGVREYYTAEQVEAACNECHVVAKYRQYLVAQFVQPEKSPDFLRKLGSSKTVDQLRWFLAQEMFFSNHSGPGGPDFPEATDGNSADFDADGDGE